MTLKQIVDALFAGKMVGCPKIGWVYVDDKGYISTKPDSAYYDGNDDELVGYLFNSCDNLEVSE